MQHETVTRLRNAFAQVALDWLDKPLSERVAVGFAPPFSSMTEADWRAAVALWRGHAAELLATVATRPCPACNGATSRPLFHSYDAHSFHECDVCGCWFNPKAIDSDVFERLFERNPEAGALAKRMTTARDEGSQRDADMARVGGYLDDLLPMIPNPDGRRLKYLDTGCGVGHSLRAGLARGLVVQGVEVDHIAVELARREGLPVVSIHERLPPGPYDLLSFWETLEHIADPLQALEKYLPELSENGLVAITVPNLNALATRTLREACAWVYGGYNTPGHINLFDVSSLDRLLARAGLTRIDADGQFGANPFDLVGYLTGATRGAFDALSAQPTRGSLPTSVAEAITAIWPGMELVERMALASPILSVVACRRGREDVFSAAIDARRKTRAAQIADQARAFIACEADYKAISARLHAELTYMTSTLQREINRRDDLLEIERAKFERTIDGRARAGIHAVGRFARWLGLRPQV
jgi:hypothetical protein